jgi:hypothetical protein
MGTHSFLKAANWADEIYKPTAYTPKGQAKNKLITA